MSKFLSRLLTIATTTFIYGVSLPVWSDDTDIYLNPQLPVAAEPLVMFTLDYRSNMGSTFNGCTNGVDVATLVANCNFSNSFATALDSLGLNDDGGRVDLFDVIIAALKQVIDPLQNVKVGLMMPHANSTGGAGCQPGDANCSSGAMVMMGFRPLVAGDTNLNKARFIDLLLSIPATNAPGFPDYHSYQLKEMYFEMFRYLTGQTIHSGHLGYIDFDNATNCSPAAEAAATCPTKPNLVNLNAPEPVHPRIIAVDPFFAGKNYPQWDETATNTPPSPGDPDPVPVESNNHQDYISPLIGITDCAKIFAINIGFGTTTGDDDYDTAIQASKAAGGMNGITLSGSNTAAQVIEFMNDADLGDGTYGTAPDIDGKQNVVSYFIMDSANNTQNQWAAAGGTTSAIELANDPDELIETLSNIFESILSVSTTFVAPSVPVNVFNRSETENEVFLALFKADENSAPFWPGNLKKLNIVPVTIPDPDPSAAPGATIESFELRGAVPGGGVDSVSAIDTDGRIKLTTLTPWTVDGTDVGMDGVIEDEAVDQKDGRAIERGGAGQQIPGYTTISGGFPGATNPALSTPLTNRRIFTQLGAVATEVPTSTGLINLNDNDTTAEDLWAEITRDWVNPPLQNDDTTPATGWANTRQADRDRIRDILRWARGYTFEDTDDPADGIPDTNVKRGWFHGDPLHSRPLAINYGARGGHTQSNPDIRIFYGTNDGFFRMVRNTNTDGSQNGQEIWSFAPRETIPVWDKLYDNTLGSNPIHPITADGSATSLVIDFNNDGTINGSDKVFLFVGLRRGGKSYYGFDVTDPDTPVFLWHISKYVDPLDPGAGVVADFAELGQTWSKPVASFKTFNNGTSFVPILVFAGGYNGDDLGDNVTDTDPAENAGLQNTYGKDTPSRDLALGNPPLVGGDDTEGNAIFVINAVTGALIWKVSGAGPGNADVKIAAMVDSIPSEVSVLDSDGDFFADRIYVGDTGGRLWRVDIADNGGTSNWDAEILLDAGKDQVNNRLNDRRFFNPPDVAFTSDDNGPFDAVMIGTGDRELPTGTDVENHFFMIKDRGVVSGSPNTNFVHNSGSSDLADLTSNCFIDGSCGVTPPDLTNGWFIKLPVVGDLGEKNLSRSVVLDGVIFFTTFSPSSGACGLSEGTGKQFALALDNATPVFDYDSSEESAPGNPNDLFDTIESGGIPVEPVTLGEDKLLFQGQAGSETIQETGATTSWRTYWYERDSS